MERPYPHLFTPLKVKNLTFKNRFFSAPNACTMIEEGHPNDYYIESVEEKARGGAGMVVISEVPVDDYGAHVVHLGLDDENRMLIGELALAVKSHGAVCSVELTHGGDAIVPARNKGGHPISSMGFYRSDGVYVHCMDEGMMEEVAAKYAQAARFFKDCGVDMCMIHAGHHWLINQFLSPLWNRRTDKYGGSLENRCRFPLMIFKAVRAAVGPDYVIDIRYGADDLTPGGNTFDDCLYFLNAVRPYIDMVHITAGARWETATLVQTTCFHPHGGIVHLAERVKKSGIGLPIIAHAGIVDPEMAEDIIASGKADAVACARAIIADPYIVKKAQTGRRDDIRPCLRCLTCLAEAFTNGGIKNCAVNPLSGREARARLSAPVVTPKKLVIIGGGPAGMQAAITAHDRGHRVVLIEKGESLGGLIRFADSDTIKEDLRRFKEYLVGQATKRTAGPNPITLLLGTEATPEMVESLAPDAVFVAAGAEPAVPRIPGIENARHASEVYFGYTPGKRVVIIGGGLVGCEVGLHLTNLGCSVTVVEALSDFARDANFMHRDGMMKYMKGRDFRVLCDQKVASIEKDGVRLEGGALLEADSVLYAVGMRARENIYLGCASEVTVLGDALRPAKVKEAVHTGYYAAMDLGDF